jgi:HEAT repeat protein
MEASAMTLKQRRAARYLARGLTQATAGQRVGVSARTIRYWLADIPGFREAASDPVEAATDPNATETLLDLLNDSDARIRLQAASILYGRPAPDPDALRDAPEIEPGLIRASVKFDV